MKQCAARQFENELVERLSILANRHLRPPAPERGPHSISITRITALDHYNLLVHVLHVLVVPSRGTARLKNCTKFRFSTLLWP